MGLFGNNPSPPPSVITAAELQRKMFILQASAQQGPGMFQGIFGAQAQNIPPGGWLLSVDPAHEPPPYDATEYPYQNTFGEIIAWRSWKWKDGALISPYLETIWAPNEIIEAHESPFKGRASGIFCHKTIEDVFHQESDNWQVVGTVLIWGDVMEHEKGYRAEFAKPYEIKHFHPDLAGTAKQYIETVFNHH